MQNNRENPFRSESNISHWQTLVQHLNLQPHPEGGYYRETFRSQHQISFNGRMRSASTVIYYLLAQGAYSAWHRIDAEETWYFHTGSPVDLHVLTSELDLLTHCLGNPIEHPGAAFQATVPAGCWFARSCSSLTITPCLAVQWRLVLSSVVLNWQAQLI